MNANIIFLKKKIKMVKIIEIFSIYMIQSIVDNKGG